MSATDFAIPSTLRFKSWEAAQGEIIEAIREIANEPRVHSCYPTSIYIEGYPGAGVTTSIFRATWNCQPEIAYRVRIHLDRYSTARAEVL